MKKQLVIIFAKYPRAGEVKTRLAKEIGDKKATEVYKQCAEYTFKVAAECVDLEVSVQCSQTKDIQAFKEWLSQQGQHNFQIESQVPDPNLGQRMYQSMKKGLEQFKKVLIIGTDAPDINSQILAQSSELLEQYDVVFGPAMDGGFYLMGLKKIDIRLFNDVTWSTDKVLQQMYENCAKLGLEVAPKDALPLIRDIDYQQDMETWLNEGDGSHPLFGVFRQILYEE